MDSALLATRLRIPPPTQALAPRPGLVDALERGVRDHKLVLVSAPAGYGKTTLLAQWARQSRFPVAWLSVGAEGNDADRFLRRLLAAWEAVWPGAGAGALGVLLGASSPDRAAVLAAFLAAADAAPDPAAFVLDDCDQIVEPSVHAALSVLVDRLPPTHRFVLAGRVDPPLPLARYRARGESLELRADDLRFSAGETADLLNRLLGPGLAAGEIARLHAQLEGWPAGLRLAALSLRRPGEMADPIGVGGEHRFVADYLSDEVLARLPEDVRRFLLQTGVLDRLCGELCDAVTLRADGQEMLERLERENLFLEPLDERRGWFRYHGPFADVLRAQLRRRRPGEARHLHRRAARWHLAHDLPEPAFRHAVAGEDPALAIEIVERYESLMLASGEFAVVRGWLDAIPMAWRAAHPAFGLLTAGLLACAGDLDACVRSIDDVERRLPAGGGEAVRRQRARATAFRCFVACFRNDLPEAERFAERALRDLPDDDLAFRADIHHALGDTYRGNGRWAQARASYRRVLDYRGAPAFPVLAAHVFGALADLELRRGRLGEAERCWREALAAVERPENRGRLPLPVGGWVHLRLAELLYERDERVAARDHLARGLERAELGGDARALIAGAVIAARLALTEGDAAAAAAQLERARPLVAQAAFPDWTGRFERGQVELWLARGKLRAAADWADATPADGGRAAGPDGEAAALALARVLIVAGGAPAHARALALLDRLLRAAEAEDRLGVRIEALALRALALWRAGDRPGALTALERALRLAEPEGYVRRFADFGPDMARLMHVARSRGVMPDYLARVLAACGPDLAGSGGATAPPEPLSRREREVLDLIAAGLTNREIGAALSISPETVKKHAASIFGKLGVDRRAAAAAKARALDLLG